MMPSNNCHHLVHYWAGKYGFLGHLYSPGGQRGPFAHLPYAIDNGAFSAWSNNRPWDESAFRKLLDWALSAKIPPMWVAVPDVVADAKKTLSNWDDWSRIVRDMGFKAALVVQDGMTPSDVQATEPDAVFIGGTTAWKYLWLWRFCDSHELVHVGRVNGYRGASECYRAGAASCDGTGYFRGNKAQTGDLERMIREQADGTVIERDPEQKKLWTI